MVMVIKDNQGITSWQKKTPILNTLVAPPHFVFIEILPNIIYLATVISLNQNNPFENYNSLIYISRLFKMDCKSEIKGEFIDSL